MQGQLTEHGRQWEPSIVQTRTTSPVSPKPHLFSTRSIAAAPSLLCVSLRPLPLWLPSPLLALSADMGGRRKRPSLRASSPALPPRASAVGAGRRKHAAPSRCSAGQCAQRPAAAATGRPRGEGNKERIRGERRARWGSFFLSLLSLTLSLSLFLSPPLCHWLASDNAAALQERLLTPCAALLRSALDVQAVSFPLPWLLSMHSLLHGPPPLLSPTLPALRAQRLTHTCAAAFPLALNSCS